MVIGYPQNAMRAMKASDHADRVDQWGIAYGNIPAEQRLCDPARRPGQTVGLRSPLRVISDEDGPIAQKS